MHKTASWLTKSWLTKYKNTSNSPRLLEAPSTQLARRRPTQLARRRPPVGPRLRGSRRPLAGRQVWRREFAMGFSPSLPISPWWCAVRGQRAAVGGGGGRQRGAGAQRAAARSSRRRQAAAARCGYGGASPCSGGTLAGAPAAAWEVAEAAAFHALVMQSFQQHTLQTNTIWTSMIVIVPFQVLLLVSNEVSTCRLLKWLLAHPMSIDPPCTWGWATVGALRRRHLRYVCIYIYIYIYVCVYNT